MKYIGSISSDQDLINKGYLESRFVKIHKADYDALPTDVKMDPTLYFYIDDRSPATYITLHQAEYDALSNAEKNDPDKYYYIDDAEVAGIDMNDNIISASSTWSSSKINTTLNTSSTFEVSTTGWTEDTTSQSGTTLYKKQISLSHVYTTFYDVCIGASSSATLPTTAEQDAYNLIEYVTVDDAVPCLYIYSSDVPTDSYYIIVSGVD